MAHALLQDAVYKNSFATPEGALERLFAFWFQRFVYNQIWEDPRVDLAALQLTPDSQVVTISSGGCNVMNYLLAEPRSITAIDLNPCHIHLARLKVAAVTYLPTHADFYAMFGHGADPENGQRYTRYLRAHLAPETRAFWDNPRHIKWFKTGLYRASTLGRFIDLLHWCGRAIGCDPAKIMDARTVHEQRRLFDEHIAPAFDTWLMRLAGKLPFVLYSLGIPPTQFNALRDACNGNLADLCLERTRRLACDYPLTDNYFAWQAFGRGYDHGNAEALPEYLKAENWDKLRHLTMRVDTHLSTMTDHLATRPAGSLDGYVLLDAQDWMDAGQLTALWTQIARTARSGARVVFRTAVEASPLPEALPVELLGQFDYHGDRSRELAQQDRSAIYGGFHLYTMR